MRTWPGSIPSLHAVRDTMLGADPAFERLRSSARAMLSTLLALAVMYELRHVSPVPIAGYVLGGVLAMFVSVAIEGRRNERVVTFVVLLVPIFAAVVGAALLSRVQPYLSGLAFLAVIFVATDARRFGPRGNVCGLAAVMGYFLARYLDVTPAELPGIAIALLVAGTITGIVREAIVPDAPRWTMRIALASFRAQRRCVARYALHYAGDDLGRRRIEKALRDLNACAVAVHGALQHERLGLSDSRRGAIGAALAGAEIAVDRLALATLAAPHADTMPPGVRCGLIALRDDDPAAASAAARALDERGDVDFDAVLVDRHGPPVPLPSHGDVLPAHTKQALQATSASAAAIVVGGFVSPVGWYWAVVASFIVFLGTSSAGETRRKVWSRVIGTAFGVGGGVVLSAWIGHEHYIDAIVVVVLFAFGLYFQRSAYFIMMFAITASLGLIYGLLGRPTDSLLVLRLVETMIGAFFSGLAATVLLPVRTTDAVADSAAAYLDGLDASIDASIGVLVGEPSDTTPEAAARALDALQIDLSARAKPLIVHSPFGASPLGRGEPVVALVACSYFARRLARFAEISGDAGRNARPDYETIRAAIRAASDTIAGRPAPARVDRDALDGSFAKLVPGEAARELRRIATLVCILAERRDEAVTQP
ncbi:MAG: hypothetical protein NVSMB19_21110 [Vulcanimicrobiaceae bacterium]